VTGPKYALAIATIFRDESRYMREWLEYHLMVGVGHFFLLQNDEPGSPEHARARALLAPYAAAGLVTVEDHTDRTPSWQLLGWARLMNSFGTLCDWVALIDLDVFMNPVGGDSVRDVVARYDLPGVAGLAAYYCTFGDSGLAEPPALQIESFVMRAPLDAAPNWTANYIIRPARTRPANGKGYAAPRDGHALVDTDGTRLPEGIGKRKGPMDVLRLHHYGVRSRADWERKVARGWPDAVARWTDPNHKHEDHKHAMLNRNDEHDASMHRFLPALKERLARDV
jgi:hypothetical protein